MEAGVEGAMEGVAAVALRAHRRHPPVDAEDGMAREAVLAAIGIGSRHHPSPSPPPSPPSTPEPKPADGFEFGVTLNYGADQDSVRLPRKFSEVVDVWTN
jgi:hypothetical protein